MQVRQQLKTETVEDISKLKIEQNRLNQALYNNQDQQRLQQDIGADKTIKIVQKPKQTTQEPEPEKK